MIGAVIHGAEPLDSGIFQEIIASIEDVGRLIMAGTTGATAVVDCGLQTRVEMLTHNLVSSAVRELSESHDLVLIINQGKTLEGSLRFASVIKSRSCPCDVPVIMMDAGFHCVLNPGMEEVWYPMVQRFCPVKREVPDCQDSDVRTLHGVIPGENVWVDGNVIGRACKSNPRIWRDDNGVLCFDGIEIRQSAFEHVKDFDHRAAKIRSGKVRRTNARPFSIPNGVGDQIILVDHDAEDCLRSREGVHLAVTIGDDTSRIAGALLYRFSIPVFGIIDGDEDGICDEEVFFPGSVLFTVRPGFDDVVGRILKNELFDGGRYVSGCTRFVEDAVRKAVSPYIISEKRH